MTNAEKFQKVFGYYATEMWAKPEKEFLEWINAEAVEHEPKRGEKAKTLFMNLYNCEKFENLSNGFIYMKIPKCSIYDEIGREWIVNCVRQDNFECCFTHAFERVERIEGERSQNCVKCRHYFETEDETGVHSQCGLESDEDGSD